VKKQTFAPDPAQSDEIQIIRTAAARNIPHFQQPAK